VDQDRISKLYKYSVQKKNNRKTESKMWSVLYLDACKIREVALYIGIHNMRDNRYILYFVVDLDI
jgi:hypothetical protein